MSEDFQFADNHRDLCIPSGTGAGFQFEFYCQCCNDTWGIVVAELIHQWLPHAVTLSLVLANYVLEHDLWKPVSPWRRAIQGPG